MGVLAGMSRLSSDSEIVALRTMGVRNRQLLRPVLLFSFATWLFSSWLIMYLAPEANFRFNRLYTGVVLSQTISGIKPGVFYQGLPFYSLYFRDQERGGDWRDVFLYSTKKPDEDTVILARRGRFIYKQGQKDNFIVLFDGVVHSFKKNDPGKYTLTFFAQKTETISSLVTFRQTRRSTQLVFPELVRRMRAAPGDVLLSLEFHKKFALPFACLALGFLGMSLGISTRKGRQDQRFRHLAGHHLHLLRADDRRAQPDRQAGRVAFLGFLGADPFPDRHRRLALPLLDPGEGDQLGAAVRLQLAAAPAPRSGRGGCRGFRHARAPALVAAQDTRPLRAAADVPGLFPGVLLAAAGILHRQHPGADRQRHREQGPLFLSPEIRLLRHAGDRHHHPARLHPDRRAAHLFADEQEQRGGRRAGQRHQPAAPGPARRFPGAVPVAGRFLHPGERAARSQPPRRQRPGRDPQAPVGRRNGIRPQLGAGQRQPDLFLRLLRKAPPALRRLQYPAPGRGVPPAPAHQRPQRRLAGGASAAARATASHGTSAPTSPRPASPSASCACR